ncbi:prepilin-type N-terminal cleavage/methylation domain-containing protein [Thermodesulfobacteriota bacterium]
MKGLTLLEVLISMVVLSIILSVVYGSYTSNVESVHIARQQAQVFQTARIALDRMERDIESAIIQIPAKQESVTPGMIGETQMMDGRRTDTINFTALTHLRLNDTSPDTDFCEIGYQLSEDPDEEALVLMRRDDLAPDDDIKKGGTSNELAWNVVGFEIVYFDQNGERFENWNTFEGIHKGVLPSLIKLTLTIKGQDEYTQTFEKDIRPELAERKREI